MNMHRYMGWCRYIYQYRGQGVCVCGNAGQISGLGRLILVSLLDTKKS